MGTLPSIGAFSSGSGLPVDQDLHRHQTVALHRTEDPSVVIVELMM